jgi:hypothetical protein
MACLKSINDAVEASCEASVSNREVGVPHILNSGTAAGFAH